MSLPKLMRDGFLKSGERVTPRVLRWSYTYTDDEVAKLVLSGSLEGRFNGWIRLQADWIDQWIELQTRPRQFGGSQWYFRCPYAGRDALALWLPPGARNFACRERWGRQVAYASQFETPYGRAISQAQKIRTRIGGPEWVSLDEYLVPGSPRRFSVDIFFITGLPCTRKHFLLVVSVLARF